MDPFERPLDPLDIEVAIEGEPREVLLVVAAPCAARAERDGDDDEQDSKDP